MYEYLTRAMVARKPMDYLGQALQPGESFVATPVDGDYFIKCGRANDAAVQSSPVIAVAPVAPPPAAEVVVVPAETTASQAEESLPVVRAPTEEAYLEEIAPQRRRGRPTNAERAAREAAAAESSGDASA